MNQLSTDPSVSNPIPDLASSTNLSSPKKWMDASKQALFGVASLLMAVGAEAATLAPFPGTSANWDQGLESVATYHQGVLATAGRTFTVTNELLSHTGNFQIDLLGTFTKTNQMTSIDANALRYVSLYATATVGDYAQSNWIGNQEVIIFNLQTFVQANGDPHSTTTVIGGNQFAPTIDFGASLSNNNQILTFSGLTTPDQSASLIAMFHTIGLGNTGVIAVSADLLPAEGLFSVISSDKFIDPTNSPVENDGQVFNNESLGLFIRPEVIPEPATGMLVMLASLAAFARRRS